METGALIKHESDYLLGNTSDEMMSNPELSIRRPVYTQEDLEQFYNYREPKKSMQEKIGLSDDFTLKNCLKKTIPVLSWLPDYDWRKNILGDVAAGFTVAVMHIPQGMAYALLGNVPPIVGIYMAFFPVLVYMIFGTSRHNSMGTFAVICMMTGKVVLSHSTFESVHHNSTTAGVHLEPINQQYSPIEVATAVTFGVGALQLAMYVLRLGVISTLLSESLVSGFTTGAAVHVFTSQIKDLLGLQLPKRRGIFKVLFTYYDVFNGIDDVNTTATLISGITILAIVFNNEVLKPRVSKFCSFPIPIEMIVVVAGTLTSLKLNLLEVYHVATVGHIPVGLPEPMVPPVALLPSILVDCFVITMVSYSISMSMALIFAQKMNYEIDANQELAAQGLGNMLGSFFSCMPFTASLSRSLVQTAVGGKTQLASLISCFLLLFVLLWIGPFLEPLPRCILAGIIVVALKGMFVQVKDFVRFCRLSSTDTLVWLATFVTVVVLDIEYGLFVGAMLCLVKLLSLSIKPYMCKLAFAPGSELYLDSARYHKTINPPGIQIFHYCGGLNFATKLHFKEEVFKAAGVKPQDEVERRRKNQIDDKNSEPLKNLRLLILDFTALNNIDPTGVATLRGVIDDYMSIGVSVYLAGCSGPVLETIRKCSNAVRAQDSFLMFPTVADAVNYAVPYHSIPTSSSVWNTCQPAYESENCSRL